MNASGLGGLSVNSVVLPFHEIPGVTIFGDAAQSAPHPDPEYRELMEKLEKEEYGPATSPLTYVSNI